MPVMPEVGLELHSRRPIPAGHLLLRGLLTSMKPAASNSVPSTPQHLGFLVRWCTAILKDGHTPMRVPGQKCFWILALDRLLVQPGPRFMAGDWNFPVESLHIVDRLHQLGWVEVQDLCLSRTGRPIVNTCKGATRKDYLWLSPELALGFLDLHVDSETFADHAVLVASFVGGRAHLERFVWPCPKPVPWSKVSVMSESVPFCSPHDPTQQYSKLWHQRESQAQLDLADEWMPGMAGWAAQIKPRRVTSSQVPLKQGRAGDIQPACFGFSAVHAKQFKQLRRLQNFCRWVDQRPQTGIVDCLHGIGLWNSILRAPGFGSSFSEWWHSRHYRSPADPVHIPQICPSPCQARQIFDAMLAEV